MCIRDRARTGRQAARRDAAPGRAGVPRAPAVGVHHPQVVAHPARRGDRGRGSRRARGRRAGRDRRRVPARPGARTPHAMTLEFDLILFGATGFTGRLVADYLKRSAEPGPVLWAIAGRSRDKLEALGLGVPIVVGDALDPAAVRAMASRTTAVCTTVGPFARYGSELVAACAEAGTHYCDLTGEVQWMRRMIDAHHERAKQTGARIVQPCGFDSIPSDIGTWATQQAFIARFGYPARKVTALFGEQSGSLSGGTVASGMETAREASEDPDVRELLRNPYGLDPEPQ